MKRRTFYQEKMFRPQARQCLKVWWWHLCSDGRSGLLVSSFLHSAVHVLVHLHGNGDAWLFEVGRVPLKVEVETVPHHQHIYSHDRVVQ